MWLRGKNDEDHRELSSDASTALQEFYAEKEWREKRFEDLKAGVGQNPPQTPLSMEMFSEDWNASQFWVEICSSHGV